jgi:hypothetical protein
MLPWLLLAAVVVPLGIVAFAASRRGTRRTEALSTRDAETAQRTEQEFADAERFEAEWREANEKRHDQHLP